MDCCSKNDAPSTDQPVDPVCGMKVDPKDAEIFEYQGKTYYFCCDGCREAFQENPAEYLKPKRTPKFSATDQRTFTCPMHLEIQQIGPGCCPVCGMALEP